MSTQIMQSVQENQLFSEIPAEESATLSGGGPVSYLEYIQLAQTPASPGTDIAVGDEVLTNGLTTGEVQTGWNILINQTGAVGRVPSP
ncbi:hypothetical protein ACEYW6_21305 [Nostoc sp. UIC 10607]|uniref:hypothetical protein n=1 Tax=Nostoc sp. UIC 10607 TaxID=3045935 RepID=UPI0039A049D7